MGIYIVEHRAIVQDVLGKKLPKNCVIHHLNGIKSDNRKKNLLVCNNLVYHFLIHRNTEKFLLSEKNRKNEKLKKKYAGILETIYFKENRNDLKIRRRILTSSLDSSFKKVNVNFKMRKRDIQKLTKIGLIMNISTKTLIKEILLNYIKTHKTILKNNGE